MEAFLDCGNVALAGVAGVVVKPLDGEVLQLTGDVVVCGLRCTHAPYCATRSTAVRLYL